MAGFNKVILMGNLTRDPELRYSEKGSPVCEFTVAVNGFDKDDVYFGAVVCFGATAENTGKYLQRGKSVLIEGKLKNESWEDRKNGEKRSRTRIVASTVLFVGNGEKMQCEQPATANNTIPKTNRASDLPF